MLPAVTAVVRTGVNFINILQAAFSNKSVLCSFSLRTVWFCNFWQKNNIAKAARNKSVGEIDSSLKEYKWDRSHSEVRLFHDEVKFL